MARNISRAWPLPKNQEKLVSINALYDELENKWVSQLWNGVARKKSGFNLFFKANHRSYVDWLVYDPDLLVLSTGPLHPPDYVTSWPLYGNSTAFEIGNNLRYDLDRSSDVMFAYLFNTITYDHILLAPAGFWRGNQNFIRFSVGVPFNDAFLAWFCWKRSDSHICSPCAFYRGANAGRYLIL